MTETEVDVVPTPEGSPPPSPVKPTRPRLPFYRSRTTLSIPGEALDVTLECLICHEGGEGTAQTEELPELEEAGWQMFDCCCLFIYWRVVA